MSQSCATCYLYQDFSDRQYLKSKNTLNSYGFQIANSLWSTPSVWHFDRVHSEDRVSSSWGGGRTAEGVADQILAPGPWFSVTCSLLHQNLRDGADGPISSTSAAIFNATSWN